ncbi:MAG TPA: hypothetical protein VN697_03395 [Tepidiformaceae bacterium]|nr:hypothetical protein [Tepidiformaceae bacterium]
MTAAQAAAIVGGVPAAAYISAAIDMTTPADNIAFLPANAGKFFLGLRSSWMVASVTGTASGSLVFSAGNDASHQNMLSTTAGTITSGVLNGLTGATAPPIIITGNNFGAFGTLLDNTTPIVIKVVTAPTGVTAGTFRLFVTGLWL